MQPVKNGEGGSRLAIVLNGSPLFTGGAGSGESNIRQWIIENDLLDAIIALPTDMFYNTGISHLHLDLGQQQADQAQGQGPAHRRRRHVRQDAQVPRLQAQGAAAQGHRADLPPLRQLPQRTRHRRAPRPLEGLQGRGVRLLHHHRRTPTATAVHAHRGQDRGSPRPEEHRQAQAR